MGGNTGNGFDKDPERARAAGRKSTNGRAWKTVYRDILEKKVCDDLIEQAKIKGAAKHLDKTMTLRDLIALKKVQLALEGNLQAINSIEDREEGKSAENVNNKVSGELKIVWPDDAEEM